MSDYTLKLEMNSSPEIVKFDGSSLQWIVFFLIGNGRPSIYSICKFYLCDKSGTECDFIFDWTMWVI